MTLLLTARALAERRAAAAGPLRRLAESLAADLRPLLAAPPELPAAKAWLSRHGGRCPADGTLLDFDPFAPHEHRCPRCGTVYRGEAHDRWWVTWYQLWLAERTVHAAVLAALVPHEAAAHAALADALLGQYADRYLAYPNRDNALGPTRPFFSTYLESIWLLQLCVALELREAAGAPPSLGVRVRERVIAPSAALVAGFDEGASNRQVWHNAALLAAGRLLGDAALVEGAAFGESGLVTHLGGGLLADGSWYEGENYHLFAHRGLWYGVQLCEAAGVELPAPLLARFGEGFATPFVTALPDLTFPARRDSQYAVSLRQWRFAELCELGLARGDDARLVGALAALYDPGVPRGDPGRWRSTAEAERNEAPSGLTRADLNWRSLLFARPALPALDPLPARSALLAGQGLAVFRRDGGRLYAALDYGHSGGGHGHPDRLNVLLAHGPTRWLDDMGTGSYVDPSLHWYRSTLAHNAPLVNGRSQRRVHGRLLAHEERPAAGWADAAADDVAPGVRLRRAIVVLDDYLVDELTWSAPEGTQVDLPLHADGEAAGVTRWEPAAPLSPNDAPAPEDGWRYVTAAELAAGSPFAAPVHLAAARGAARADAWVLAGEGAELWRATAPGPPGAGERRFHFVRSHGATGTVTTVWSWAGSVAGVARSDGGVRVILRDGGTHDHARTPEGWHIALAARGARSSIDLGGARRTTDRPSPTGAGRPTPAPRAPVRVPRVASGPATDSPVDRALVFELGEPHYRQSEQSWSDAGCPTARVAVAAAGDTLVVDVAVHAPPLAFAPARTENPLDNEPADTNSDGVQLYVQLPDGRLGAWILVPETDGGVRVSRGSQAVGEVDIAATWRPMPDGYAVHCRIPLASRTPEPAPSAVGETAPSLVPRLALDVVINETTPERERRRGQLVLSGGAGEFVYLRGDRQPPERFIPFTIAAE